MDPGEIVRYFPKEMKKAFLKGELSWEGTEEIRIRTGKPVLIYENSREYILNRENKEPYVAGEEEIGKVLDQMTGYSMYAYEEEFKQGYFTLEGGHRVGLAGKTVVEGGCVKTIKNIQFLNIRIAHEKRGCAKQVIGKLIENGSVKHTLILSPPGCGKTTLLRDLIRLLSDGFYYESGGIRIRFPGVTVGVVDERSEIGACVKGVPTMNLGMRTDLMDGCPKHVGIFMLLRSMGPKVIAVDEIGGEKDFEAIRQAVNSGCIILATAHGTQREELEKKELFGSFLKEQIFKRYVILSGKKRKGTIERIEEMP